MTWQLMPSTKNRVSWSPESSNWYVMVIDGFDVPAFVDYERGTGPCFAKGAGLKVMRKLFEGENATRTATDQIKPLEIGPELKGPAFYHYLSKALQRDQMNAAFLCRGQDRYVEHLIFPDHVLDGMKRDPKTSLR